MSRRDETASRVEAQLGRMGWPTAGEVAGEINLSAGTARKYLHRLVAEGRAQRRQDPDVPNPQGDGGWRFDRLDPPIPPAAPTADRLCPSCIKRDYGDLLRYFQVATRDLEDDAPDASEDYDTYVETARCDRCGGRRFPDY